MSDSAIVQMLVSGQEDLLWFGSKIDELRANYDNKFVAFHNGSVVDFDSNLDILLDKLHKRNIDLSNILIKFVSKIKSIL